MRSWTVRQYLSLRMAKAKVPGRRTHRGMANWLGMLMADEQRRMRVTERPACFGAEFDAPQNKRCAACPVQVQCMAHCAHNRLLDAQHACGSLAVADIARHTGWRPDIVRRLQNVCRITEALRPQDVNRVAQPQVEGQEPQPSWPLRFLKERRRMPMLAYLKPGAKILRPYAGRVHVVEVLDGTYLYSGEHYPTLYRVAMAITGHKLYGRVGEPQGRRTMGNFSAAKFFMKAIEQAMPAL